MNKVLIVAGTSLLALGILSACNSDDGDNEVIDNKSTASNSEGGILEEIDVENAEEIESANTSPTALGDFENQLDLRLGDAAQFSDTLGSYEVIIHSAKKMDEIDGILTDLNYFAVMKITVKNIGDGTINPLETIKAFQLTDDLELGGYGEVSDIYDFSSVDGFPEQIEPGEEVTKEAVFEALGEGDQHLRITPGLISSGAVQNEVVITITEEEFE